jgi:hypothetical protein
MVLNMAAAGERERVLGAVAASVARRGDTRALAFEVVAAGTPFDAGELEEGRLLMADGVTVAPPERLRSWDIAVPDVDLSVLRDDDLAIPTATASIALSYRSETTFHEYTVDPLSDDVPQAAADVLGDLSEYTSVLERVGADRWNPVSWVVQGSYAGVSAWNVVDDVVGDAHPRVDTSVVVDATFYDADGAVVGRVDAIGIERTAATGPLFAAVGSVLVVPAPDAGHDDDDGGS